MEIEPVQPLNRYKEVVYEEVEYDAPDEILARIKNLNTERNSLITLLEQA